jgi:hypothetical protein
MCVLVEWQLHHGRRQNVQIRWAPYKKREATRGRSLDKGSPNLLVLDQATIISLRSVPEKGRVMSSEAAVVRITIETVRV